MTDTLNGRVAANIRAEMARRQINQETLAAATGLSRPALSDLLLNKTQITLTKLDAIAHALEVEPAKLIND
jgi:transcriptional regulator with XRE-family HTH domain